MDQGYVRRLFPSSPIIILARQSVVMTLTLMQIIIRSCALLYVTSLMLTSLCDEYYQFMLCQGVLGGIMNGLVYAPEVSVIGQYFHRRRALAMGIASSGSSLGGVIFPIMLTRLLYHTSVGFGWSVRIVGFMVLGLALVASFTIVPRMTPHRGPLFLHNAFNNAAYSLSKWLESASRF